MCFSVDDRAGGENDLLDVVVPHGFEDVVGGDDALVQVKVCLCLPEPYVGVCGEVEDNVMAVEFFNEFLLVEEVCLNEGELCVVVVVADEALVS